MQDPDNTGWLNKMQTSVLFTKNSLFCFQVETNKTIGFVLLTKQNASYMIDVFETIWKFTEKQTFPRCNL